MTSSKRTYLRLNRFDSGKVDIVFLDNTRVQRVEVHDKYVLVPETTLGFEDQTSLVLVPLALVRSRGTVTIFGFRFHSDSGFLAPSLVWADVLQAMEFVQENVFVTLRATSVQGFVP